MAHDSTILIPEVAAQPTPRGGRDVPHWLIA